MTDIFSTVIALFAIAISIHNAFKDEKIKTVEDLTYFNPVIDRVNMFEKFQEMVMTEKVSKILENLESHMEGRIPTLIVINKNYERYVRKHSNDKLKSTNENLWYGVKLVRYLEGDITFENIEVIFKNITEEYKLYYGGEE